MVTRALRHLGRAAAAGTLAAVALGCQSLEETVAAPALDEAVFRCNVEPVLVARCGFPACHGSAVRPFRVYGPNRLRLDPTAYLKGGYLLGGKLSAAERRANYDMARGFAFDEQVGGSLLLLKPLDIQAGGLFHRGKTLYGGVDVFASTADPDYRAIEDWLADRGAVSGKCTGEPGP
jgi:hypothetical protein